MPVTAELTAMNARGQRGSPCPGRLRGTRGPQPPGTVRRCGCLSAGVAVCHGPGGQVRASGGQVTAPGGQVTAGIPAAPARGLGRCAPAWVPVLVPGLFWDLFILGCAQPAGMAVALAVCPAVLDQPPQPRGEEQLLCARSGEHPAGEGGGEPAAGPGRIPGVLLKAVGRSQRGCGCGDSHRLWGKVTACILCG